MLLIIIREKPNSTVLLIEGNRMRKQTGFIEVSKWPEKTIKRVLAETEKAPDFFAVRGLLYIN